MAPPPMPFSMNWQHNLSTVALRSAIPGSIYVLSGLPGPNSPHGPGNHNQEREKNVAILSATGSILERAIDMLDCELEIVRKEMEHPERFIDRTTPEPVTPLASWGGTLAQLLELIIALFLTGLIRKSDSRKMNLAEVAEFLKKKGSCDPGIISGIGRRKCPPIPEHCYLCIDI